MTGPLAPRQTSYDVVVIGGGPGGSTAATLLARAGKRVVLFEREAFPRFHIGESLLPANVPLFDRLGCHEALRQAGFMVKPGSTFRDAFEGRNARTIRFQTLPFQPDFAYNVRRADFDTLLLRHAAHNGVAVYEQHAVEDVQVQPQQVLVRARDAQGAQHTVQAACVVDASGRSAFLGGQQGQRLPVPGLGRVAFFAHFRGVEREADIPAGNICIHLVPEGWLWWIPFADGTDSLGCVLHSRVAKARQGSIEQLFMRTLAASPHLAKCFERAERLTPVHTAANFSYRVIPASGDRFVTVGDALGFVDPIFSAGVFLAMRSAELATEAILQAFARQDFRARQFRSYEARVRWGMCPMLSLIRRFYDPALLDLLFSPDPPQYFYRCVVWVLSGAAFDRRPWWMRLGLQLFWGITSLRGGIRWITGQPTESRWQW